MYNHCFLCAVGEALTTGLWCLIALIYCSRKIDWKITRKKNKETKDSRVNFEGAKFYLKFLY